MEKMTFKDFKHGKGYFDISLRDDDIVLLQEEGVKDDDIIINFAYTDYGGDFLDKVCIQFFLDRKEKTFHAHNTVYYGKNAILWGDIAKKFLEECQSYPLGFENLEDFYSEKEGEARDKQAQDFLNDYKDEDNKELSEHEKECAFNIICDKLSEHSILPSGTIDICESELDEALRVFLEGDYKILLSQERERIIDIQTIGKIE